MSTQLVMGAVAYDEKVVTIWQGFRRWFAEHDVPFDFVLYSNYERQVEDLVAGRVDLAWNSPLAFVRAERLAGAVDRTVRAVAARDTDRDLTSVVVVRADSGIDTVEDLTGRRVATGAVDSPQATLLPLTLLADLRVPVSVRRFDVGVGLHGDHVGGERDAARALVAGEVDAAAMLDATHLLLTKEGVLSPGVTRVVAQTAPYDHCAMTATDATPAAPLTRFVGALLGMSYADPAARPLMDLEGLAAWQPGRPNAYRALRAAVDRMRFYGPAGELTATSYAP
jgi:ABC-type phosphate/phosphonate transport system substrate-binding protein